MAIYSHSKVSTFQQCPQKYKFQYIDKIELEVEDTIETFMGGIVHKTLEKLYKDFTENKFPSKLELLKFYNDCWEKEYYEDILIVKKQFSAEDYRKMGLRFVRDYYDRHQPFNQLYVLALETEDKLVLDDSSEWHVRIDKLCKDNEGNYYVCDYKTNSRMKEQYEADTDRQLAMYSIWVRDNFKDAKSVKLVWHMLAFNSEVISERTDDQLGILKNSVINQIKKIEEATKNDNFPTNITPLCNYCLFKHLCPAFNGKGYKAARDDIRL